MGWNPDFRANPNRSIHIRGEIGQRLVDSVAPAVFALQFENRSPITVYIDSPGGSIESADLLLRLLRASDQDNTPPCRILTAASGLVASAAAHLLCSGDYAMIQPETVVHFHGVRYPVRENITQEDALWMTELLKDHNAKMARVMAQRCFSRFLHRYLLLSSKWPEIPGVQAFVEDS
ncbi:MAG: ATP-dependent Clp protease proteolytic subunit [Acidobacteria bacterium]|nr:ATP-dependent Clp protease proteolytic subunit [Acidobacteriota bacterium]